MNCRTFSPNPRTRGKSHHFLLSVQTLTYTHVIISVTHLPSVSLIPVQASVDKTRQDKNPLRIPKMS